MHAGFIVAGPTHTGDNDQDHSRALTQRNFTGRATQVSRVIDYMLSGWSGHAAIDPQRIGMLGHAAGGTTTYLAIGGRVDPGRVIGYCRDNPQDWPCNKAREQGGPAGWDAEGAPIAGRDARIRAAVLAAPALSHGYVQPVSDIPVQLWVSAEDAVVTDAASARHWLARADYHAVPGAGHFPTLAPCGTILATMAPEICSDPPGFDRVAFLAGFQRDVVAFFRRWLES